MDIETDDFSSGTRELIIKCKDVKSAYERMIYRSENEIEIYESVIESLPLYNVDMVKIISKM